MKKSRLKDLFLASGIAIISLMSCKKTPDETPLTINNLKGIFVVCEGDFGNANGDITFYDQALNQTTRNLFSSVNGTSPGDVVQAFEIVDTLGFIVVNNSQKVIVVNMKNFRVIKTITGFSYPRSVVRADTNTVYISNGNGTSGNYVYSISLKTLEKSDSLQLSTGPEKMIRVNSKVYTAISGGWNNDGKAVIEIDPASFSIVKTYTVASVPVDLVPDKDNDLWVYCKGIADYSNYPDVTYSDAGISKINVTADTVTTLSITNMSSAGINNIAASKDGTTIYYLNDALYSMPVTATSLPLTRLVDQQFYGVDTDPKSGNIVCLDIAGSRAIVYNTGGTKLFDFATGIFPNSAVFSY